MDLHTICRISQNQNPKMLAGKTDKFYGLHSIVQFRLRHIRLLIYSTVASNRHSSMIRIFYKTF